MWLAMHRFTDKRNKISDDEIWLVQHLPVFTQGHAGNANHLRQPGVIPVIKSDRGGHITFHAPGQQIVYVLLDLRRRKLLVRNLINLLEKTVIATLARFSIDAYARTNAPGVYVGVQKICSLGLRIRKGCTLHGLALNVSMDLSPFLRINPCGYFGLSMTQVTDIVPNTSVEEIVPILLNECLGRLESDSPLVEIESWDPSIYSVI